MNRLRRLDPTFGLLLLAATLLLRAAVPSGFMPVADQHGVRVAICTGSGPATVTIDPGPPQKDPPRDPCPYGLATGDALDLPVAIVVPAAPAFVAVSYPGLAAARLTAWRALRPPARGPPAFA